MTDIVAFAIAFGLASLGLLLIALLGSGGSSRDDA